MRFTLFALVVRALQAAGVVFGDDQFTEVLRDELEAPSTAWLRFVDVSVKVIRTAYKIEAARYKNAKREVLAAGNYFKSQSYISKVFDKPLPKVLRDRARAVS